MIVLQILASGILLGGIYALISVGLNLIFGVIKVVNMAHGEFLMLGMYASYFLYTATHMNIFLITVLLFPVLMAVGYAAFINQYFDGELYCVWPAEYAQKEGVLFLPSSSTLSAGVVD